MDDDAFRNRLGDDSKASIDLQWSLPRGSFMTPPEVSIIVVNYNTREMTLDCLRSVQQRTLSWSYELLVVDNASHDGSAAAIRDAVPDARLFEATSNLGFATANNLAAEGARGRYLLLLNSDTLVRHRAIDRLMAAAHQAPEAGIWGGSTIFADGTVNPTNCWRRPTPWSLFCYGSGLAALFRGSSRFDAESYGPDSTQRPGYVDIVSGCFLLIRADLWHELKGFDPTFFMYGEEADLCLRARNHGATPRLCPEAQIIHYGGASSQRHADKLVRLFNAKRQLIRRHWPRAYTPVGIGMLGLWALTRSCAWQCIHWLSRRHANAAQNWQAVWNRRREWLYTTPLERPPRS
jgi:GT2 family glycosyltransferase